MCLHSGDKLCRRGREGVLVGRVWFSTADQLSSVADVQEIKCMLWRWIVKELYINFIVYCVTEEREVLSTGSAVLQISEI